LRSTVRALPGGGGGGALGGRAGRGTLLAPRRRPAAPRASGGAPEAAACTGLDAGPRFFPPRAGQVITYPGEGMPRTSDPSRRGNLHVRLQVVFPASLAGLSDAQRTALRRALGG
jgi:hypothetical protein